MTSGIYRITNEITGHTYVGSSNNVERRIDNHRCALNKGNHRNEHLQRAWKKYGSEAFLFDLVIDVPVDRLLDVEQEYLDSEKPTYNIRMFASRLGPPSEETRQKIGRMSGASRVGKPRGPMSEDLKQRLSVLATGRQHSKEARQKMSVWRRGRVRGPLSEETRRKISEAKTGRSLPPRSEEHCRKISEAHQRRAVIAHALLEV